MRKSFLVFFVVMAVLFASNAGLAIERVTNPIVTDEYVRTYTSVADGSSEITVTPTVPSTGVEFITDGTFSVQLNATAAGYATDSTEMMIRPGITKVDFFPITTIHVIKTAGSSVRNITIRAFRSL